MLFEKQVRQGTGITLALFLICAFNQSAFSAGGGLVTDDESSLYS